MIDGCIGALSAPKHPSIPVLANRQFHRCWSRVPALSTGRQTPLDRCVRHDQPGVMALRLPEPVRELVVRQGGLVTRAQCIDAGLAPSQVTRLASVSGRGQQVLPRVYCLRTGPLSRRQLLVAALLYAGTDAQLTGVTSLQLRGLTYVPADDRVHVLLPAARRVASRSFVIVRRTTDLPRAQGVTGLPTTPAARSAIDACRDVRDVRSAVALLAEAVQRRTCTRSMLGEELAKGPRQGSAVARRALATIASGADSAPEADMVELLATSRFLPPPQVNHHVWVRGRQYVADFCWPQARLIIEIDSVEHHGYGPAAERTARRRAELTADGWTVLSISPARLRRDRAVVLGQVEDTYLRLVAQQAG